MKFLSSPYIQIGSKDHPHSYPIGGEVISRGVKRRQGVILTTHLHVAPTLRTSGATPLLPLQAFMA